MAAALILATIVDLALAALLTAVCGFVLEGVNNTGPEMPAAFFLVAFVALCLVAPAAAWMLRNRSYRPALVLGLAFAPPVIAALALLLEPVLS